MPCVNLRFQKFDTFKNAIFISSDTKPEESESFTKLKNYYLKIKDTTKTFLPIYSSEVFNYSTIKVKRDDVKHINLRVNNMYKLEFSIKKMTKDGDVFYNCFTKKITFVKRAEVMDFGEEFQLD